MAKKSKSIRRKKASTEKKLLTIPTSDTEAALEWLSQVSEPPFRDQVLRDIFKEMKRRGEISSFKNIHGPGEHGIDYLLIQNHPFLGELWTGVQAKSKEIRTSSNSESIAAIEIANQCQRAAVHDFSLDGKTSRLNLIQVWSSRLITPEAENDINARGHSTKVTIKRPIDIVTLVKDYAPDWLYKIPQCALAQIIQSAANPEPELFKLLGTRINIKDHFIEPTFQKSKSVIKATIVDDELKQKEEETLKLTHVYEADSHTLIRGSNMSGKSFLLKRVRYLAAEESKISVICDAEIINRGDLTSLPSFLAKLLRPLNRHDINTLLKTAQVTLCIDDFHLIEKRKQDQLSTLSTQNIRLVATAKENFAPPNLL